MPNKKYKIEKNEQFSILYVPTNTKFLKRNMLFDKILLFQPQRAALIKNKHEWNNLCKINYAEFYISLQFVDI